MDKKFTELTEEKLEQVSGGNCWPLGNDWTITIKNFGDNIFVKVESFTLQVTPNTTVLEVKQMINEKFGVHTDAQLLILLGKKLEEPNTLIDSGVKNGSVISLCVKFHW